MKAIPAAANKSAPALAKRNTENKRFLLNECGVFMFLVELNQLKFPCEFKKLKLPM
jgi:hypothetical protein